MRNTIGKLIVITGFSGAGKDTLINHFLQKRKDFEMVITHSTRPQREGEIPGVHHHFIQKNEFETLVQKGEMLEYVRYGSFYKGTSKQEFAKILSGKNLIWRVDILRAAVYKETFLQNFDKAVADQITANSLNIFIKTQSHRVALKQYLGREKEKADIVEFQKRLRRDIKVYKKHKNKFPNIILNRSGKMKQSAREMERIIDSLLVNI